MKKNRTLLVYLIFNVFIVFSQTQIGSDIYGDNIDDRLGYSVSSSADGNIIAVGAPNWSGSGIGYVRLFENNSGTWSQIGSDLEGEELTDTFGYSVSISSDGSMVAIGNPNYQIDSGVFTGYDELGYVRVFKNVAGTWTQVGSDIVPIYGQGIRSGKSVSLSGNGQRVAISGFYGGGDLGEWNGGNVRVYEFNETDDIWEQIGTTFAKSDWLYGVDLSLSFDGSILGIGSAFGLIDWSNHAGPPTSEGSIYIYEFNNSTEEWSQLGSEIMGSEIGDLFGTSLSLSSAGDIIAVGAPQKDKHSNDETGDDETGYVRIYQFQNGLNTWSQIGSDIVGEILDEQSGHNVSLSSDGTIVVNRSNISGKIRVYQLTNGSWVKSGSDIDGISDNGSVSCLTLSSNGSRLVMGSYSDDTNGIDSGSTTVLDISSILPLEDTKLISFSVYPNPANNQFTIKIPNQVNLESAIIYSSLGKQLIVSKNNIVDTSRLSIGSYFVEINTNKGKYVKRIIVQ